VVVVMKQNRWDGESIPGSIYHTSSVLHFALELSAPLLKSKMGQHCGNRGGHYFFLRSSRAMGMAGTDHYSSNYYPGGGFGAPRWAIT
jgi:uncharacterized membrane protein